MKIIYKSWKIKYFSRRKMKIYVTIVNFSSRTTVRHVETDGIVLVSGGYRGDTNSGVGPLQEVQDRKVPHFWPKKRRKTPKSPRKPWVFRGTPEIEVQTPKSGVQRSLLTYFSICGYPSRMHSRWCLAG